MHFLKNHALASQNSSLIIYALSTQYFEIRIWNDRKHLNLKHFVVSWASRCLNSTKLKENVCLCFTPETLLAMLAVFLITWVMFIQIIGIVKITQRERSPSISYFEERLFPPHPSITGSLKDLQGSLFAIFFWFCHTFLMIGWYDMIDFATDFNEGEKMKWIWGCSSGHSCFSSLMAVKFWLQCAFTHWSPPQYITGLVFMQESFVAEMNNYRFYRSLFCTNGDLDLVAALQRTESQPHCETARPET